MKRTIYLHIGTHKTATTTIQAGCVENRAALREAGWHYPETGMYLYGQHNIAWEFARDRKQAWNHVTEWVAFRPDWGGIAQLQEEVRQTGAPNVIVSSEDFDGLEPDRIMGLRQAFGDDQVEIIIYLREQYSLFQSAWAQFVKAGFVTDAFPVWVEKMLASGPEVLHYFGNYFEFLQDWAAAFGKEHIHVQEFSKTSIQGHIFHDFLRACDVPSVERFPIPANKNISPGFKVLEITRRLNSQCADPRLRRYVSGAVQEYARQQGWEDGHYHLVNRALYEQIQAHFNETNDRVAREYLGREKLFNTPFKDQALTMFDPVAELGAEGIFNLTAYVIADAFSRLMTYFEESGE
ncbi:MAG: hypothetical protein JW750_09605 [Anaerolineaceae bacterium]|nr:hypothetical protein [Anaerolineaceae bacterium]